MPGEVKAMVRPRAVCQTCGTSLIRNGKVSTILTDLPRGRQPTELHLTAQRVKCPNGCSQPEAWTGIRAAPVSKTQPRLTHRLQQELFQRYLNGEPASALAAWCGLSVTGTRNLLRGMTEEKLHQPRAIDLWSQVTHIGIDEKVWQGRVLCIVVDLSSGELLEVLPDRHVSTLRSFLTEMNRYRTEPPIFATDMWSDYRSVLHDVYGPDVRQVADRFHIQSKITRDLSEIAKLILEPGQHRSTQLRRVQHHYRSVLKNAEPRPPSTGKYSRGDAVLEAIHLAADATRIWESTSVAEAEHWITEWEWQRYLYEQKLQKYGVAGYPFGRFAYLLQVWRTEILAYFDAAHTLPDGSRPSSGRVEAVNSKIARFLRKSKQARRRPFRGEAAHEEWDEQGQFNRLWVRLIHGQDSIQHLPRRYRIQPAYGLPDCCCGTPASKLEVEPVRALTLWDRPLGPYPVQVTVNFVTAVCPACQKKSLLPFIPASDCVTRELRQDIVAWRREGSSFNQLHRMTGVPVARLKVLLENALPEPGIIHPPLVGVLQWKWRGILHWVITDPAHGLLVDLLPIAEPASAEFTLSKWMSEAQSHGVRQVMLNSLEWADYIKTKVDFLVDRFTTVQLAQRALQEVTWRYSQSLSMAQRQAPELRRHRFVLLANPGQYRRLDDRLRQSELLERRNKILENASLLSAVKARESLQSIFQLKDEHEIQKNLYQWVRETGIDTRHDAKDPQETSLHYGLKAATLQAAEYLDTITRGLYLQATQQISLASSRRLLRTLNEHPAARQSDFEFLRRSALYTHGMKP